TGKRDFGRALAVDLDRAAAELGEPAALVLAVRPEVRLDHHRGRPRRQRPQQFHGGAAEPPRPGQIRLRGAEHVVQRLLDRVLGEQRVAERGGERPGQARLPRPRRSRDVHQPPLSHYGLLPHHQPLPRSAPHRPAPHPADARPAHHKRDTRREAMSTRSGYLSWFPWAPVQRPPPASGEPPPTSGRKSATRRKPTAPRPTAPDRREP